METREADASLAQPASATAYLDANVIVRHLTNNPPEMAAQASELFAVAEAGRMRLLVPLVTLTEVVWALATFYKFARPDIAERLLLLATADGVDVEHLDEATLALSLYRDWNIDFADALLAARSLLAGPPVVYSFDRHFDRVPGVTRRQPGKPIRKKERQ